MYVMNVPENFHVLLKLKIFSNFFVDGLQEREQNKLYRNTSRGKSVVCYSESFRLKWTFKNLDSNC